MRRLPEHEHRVQARDETRARDVMSAVLWIVYALALLGALIPNHI